MWKNHLTIKKVEHKINQSTDRQRIDRHIDRCIIFKEIKLIISIELLTRVDLSIIVYLKISDI